MSRIAVLVTLLSLAACAQPPQGFGGPRRMGRSEGLNNAPVPRDEAEKKILSTAAQVDRYLNVPEEDARLIRLLVESSGAKTAVELGTSTGYSGLWFALALRATGGHLTTFEYDAGRARTARDNFTRAGVDSLITIVEGDAHEKIKSLKGPIDIVFIDADKEGYLDYLKQLLPLVKPGGLILAHNITSRSSIADYVEAVTTNPQLETLLLNTQMAVTLKKR
ncbi:MAG: class I SAM-dependent methyltransferase [Acidobacteria bacterium]|nr:class I SAM-dependent methyltransferase [Acidobacteriota bacterium]